MSGEKPGVRRKRAGTLFFDTDLVGLAWAFLVILEEYAIEDIVEAGEGVLACFRFQLALPDNDYIPT